MGRDTSRLPFFADETRKSTAPYLNTRSQQKRGQQHVIEEESLHYEQKNTDTNTGRRKHVIMSKMMVKHNGITGVNEIRQMIHHPTYKTASDYNKVVDKFYKTYPKAMKYLEPFLPLWPFVGENELRHVFCRKLIPQSDTAIFWYFMDLIKQEYAAYENIYDMNYGMWNNRDMILKAFLQGRMYTLAYIPHNQETNDTSRFLCFLHDNIMNYPVIMIESPAEANVCTMLWVAPFARRMGLGSLILEQRNITKAINIVDVPSSIEFWFAKTNIIKYKILSNNYLEI